MSKLGILIGIKSLLDSLCKDRRASYKQAQSVEAGSRKGNYGVVKRDLDYGGPESLYIPFDLPVSWDEVNDYATKMDKLELLNNPNSGFRYFPTELTDKEVREHRKSK